MDSLQITLVEIDNIFFYKLIQEHLQSNNNQESENHKSPLAHEPINLQFSCWLANVKVFLGHVDPYFQTNKEKEIGKEK